jgi:hypothetical protein
MTAGCISSVGSFTRAVLGEGGSFVVSPGPFGIGLRRLNTMPAVKFP